MMLGNCGNTTHLWECFQYFKIKAQAGTGGKHENLASQHLSLNKRRMSINVGKRSFFENTGNCAREKFQFW